tara:strand:+ start:3183 stop:3587 length:405 start_codon:yes stop_codon:yes gene_type:complete
MAKGYFFIDPRTCEDVLYVPRVFEVRCFDGREIKYSVFFSKNKLEKYAIADSLHADGVFWGVKNGLVELVDIEDDVLREICELCEVGDRESKKQANNLAVDVFDLINYGMREGLDEGGFEDDDFKDFDMPIDGT